MYLYQFTPHRLDLEFITYIFNNWRTFCLLQEVFTVSVGNLPTGAVVVIKITYVTELQVDGDLINFRLPGSVAPWKQKFVDAPEFKDKV